MRKFRIYEAVGVSAGTTESKQEVVGLLLPKENPSHEDDYDEFYFTLPAAKALLLDLQGAIDIAVKHKGGAR